MKSKKISVDLTAESANNIKFLREYTGMSQSEIVDSLLNILSPQIVIPLLEVAKDENLTLLDLLENKISVGLYPTHRKAKYWALGLCDENVKIMDVFVAIFQFMAAGINFKAAYDNGLPLVKQFMDVINKNTIIGQTANIKNEIHYMKNQFDSIYNLINHYTLQNKDKYPSIVTQSDLNYVKELYNSFELCSFGKILYVIDDYWYAVGNHTRTYRLLASFARQITDFSDTPITRHNLRKAIIEVSSKWD